MTPTSTDVNLTAANAFLPGDDVLGQSARGPTATGISQVIDFHGPALVDMFGFPDLLGA
jgi:hypothetical protein